MMLCLYQMMDNLTRPGPRKEGSEIPYVLPGGPGRLVMDVQPSLSHPGDLDLTVQHRSPLTPSGES